MTKKWRIFWILASVAVMAVIFWFSSQNSGKSLDFSDSVAEMLKIEQEQGDTRVSDQKLFFGLTLRKIAHIILFAALGFCLSMSFAGIRLSLLYAAGGGYLYAVLDEIHQSYSGRLGQWQDTLIDLIGVAIGILAALAVGWLWKAIIKKEECDSEN